MKVSGSRLCYVLHPFITLFLLSNVMRPSVAASDSSPIERQRCPSHETVFVANGYDPSKPYGYRLIIHEKSLDSVHPLTDESWVIQTFDRKTDQIMNDIMLKRSCPVGKGNCKVTPRHKGRFHNVEEIGLDADLKPVRDKPHVIIIPGFTDWVWVLMASLADTGDLKVRSKALGTPDLSDQLIWVASCSDTSSDR